MHKQLITHFKNIDLIQNTIADLLNTLACNIMVPHGITITGGSCTHSRGQLLLVASHLLLFKARLADIADTVYKPYPLTTSVKKEKKKQMAK